MSLNCYNDCRNLYNVRIYHAYWHLQLQNILLIFLYFRYDKKCNGVIVFHSTVLKV